MRSRLPIGAGTWIYGDLPLSEIAQRVARLGFDGVELLADPAGPAAEARRILDDHGLTVLSVIPANVDLAHPDAGRRRAAVDHYLTLVEFAAGLGHPLVTLHGAVGRVAALSSQAEDYALFVDSVRQVAEAAAQRELRVVIEVLNRYESHLVNTASQAVAFVAHVGAPNLGVLLDAFHMNIEERDPVAALRLAGERCWLYHVGDSNRQGIGRGHTDFAAQLAALAEIGYAGPIVLECLAAGPDPFTAAKDGDWRGELEIYLAESLAWLRAHISAEAHELA